MKLYVLDLTWEGTYGVVANSLEDAKERLSTKFDLTRECVLKCENFIAEYEISDELAYQTCGE